MTGVGAAPSEARSYNSLGQMTQLTVGALNKKYNFSSNLTPGSQNNGKIISEEDVASGEKVEYLYDSLNRLQLAETATTSVGVPWGQSFAYDGFGNLSNVNVTKGDQNTIPSLAVSYLASTNRRTSDCADANGNISPCGSTYTYDVENRIAVAPIAGGTARYSYAPGNKRIWRGTWVSGSQTVDELTYYEGASKLTAYNLTVSGSNLRAASTGYYEFFGGKMIRNAGGYVTPDRLGSIGKFFPYGQERPSATSNGKEKFATYFRDSETGLDYADNRYHSSGDGRFLSPDPYVNSAGLSSPGSWNRYAYVEGDPINGYDPQGLATVYVGVPNSHFTGGVTVKSGSTPTPPSTPTSVATVMGGHSVTQRTDLRPAYCFENEAYFNNPSGMPPECMDPNWQPPSPPTGPSWTVDSFTVEECTFWLHLYGECGEGDPSAGAAALGAASPLGRAYQLALVGALAAARGIGQAGETLVQRALNLAKNTQAYGGRIPDFVDDANRLFIEVKTVGYLPFSQQLRDTLAAATARGYQYTIYVLQSTRLSGPLQEAVDAGAVLIEYIPYLP